MANVRSNGGPPRPLAEIDIFDVTPVLTIREIACSSLGIQIPSESVIGTIGRTMVKTHPGPVLEYAMEGRVYRDEETDNHQWQVIREPNLNPTFEEANDRFTTCSMLVNRNRGVIDAPPKTLAVCVF